MPAVRPSPPPASPRPAEPRHAGPEPQTPCRAPTASRLHKEHTILAEAEKHFAQFGFEGTSLESIAADVGMSRHNLLYYFPNKEVLYQRVLDDVLNEWLLGMEALSHSDDPSDALRHYIRAKLQYSRLRPQGVKVFTKEVIAGAPRYSQAIAKRVGPLLKTEVRTFERWASEGRIAKINFTHLMFLIWSMTQAYAEQQAQFALLLGKATLTERDYDKAEEVIVRMVLSALEPNAPATR